MDGKIKLTFLTCCRRGIDNGEFRNVDAEEAALALGAVFEGLENK